MLDEPKAVIRKKIKSAVTDSSGVIEFDLLKNTWRIQPFEPSSLLLWWKYWIISGALQGVGYGQFKEELADAIIGVMEPTSKSIIMSC